MATSPNKAQQIRVFGGGYTIFYASGTRIKLAQTVQETPPVPVAPPQAVQPMDAQRPVAIAFPKAVREGSLTCVIFEEWDRNVWRQFYGFRTGVFSDLADVFERSAALGGVPLAQVIKDPLGNRRLINYESAFITNIDMGANIAVDTLTVGRAVTFTYLKRRVVGG